MSLYFKSTCSNVGEEKIRLRNGNWWQEKDHILRTFKPMVPIFPTTTSFLQVPCANTLNSIDFIWTGFLSTVTRYTVLIMHVLVAQSCPTLCEPMDCSKPGSSVEGISQARIFEWIAISFFRGSSKPWDRTQVSHTPGRFFTIWVTREVTLTSY